jgi:hypothetical protein
MRVTVSTDMNGLFLLILITGIMLSVPSLQVKDVSIHEEGFSQCMILPFSVDTGLRDGYVNDLATAGLVQLKYGTNMLFDGVLFGHLGFSLNLLGGDYEWYYFFIALFLGLLSGISPILMRVHSDIISEVARTTREESDVFARSLIFYVGILAVTALLFFIFNMSVYLHFVLALFGVAIFVNLLNSGLHSFNSYTKVDLFIKATFLTLDSSSVLKLGLLHGIAKFSDSVPFFFPVMCLVIARGSFSQDLVFFILFLTGIVLSYVIILSLAMARINLFKKFRTNLFNQLYFVFSGLIVMGCSVWLFWQVSDELNVYVGLIAVVAAIVITGMLIGFKRRIVY